MVSFVETQVELRKSQRGDEKRSAERLKLHYMVERRLADRVRAASTAEERRAVFATMYDELFRLVPDHPRLLARQTAQQERVTGIAWDMAQLKPFIRPGCTFLEIGAGDCALAARVAGVAGQVYAVDIADQTREKLPRNVQLALSDGRSIPVPEGCVDVAFSDQLMEHLHPEDAMVQLANIHRALKPGGVYVCITPNRLYGPSDISAYFDDEARGFHLREYSVRELRQILQGAGFPRVQVFVGARGFFARCPAWLVEGLELALEVLPVRLRRFVADNKLMRALLGVRVAAIRE
ncbi:MAG TPA: class I SAM-dependent methyltransferase [Usitatibacter sp.]|jgi:SAM-dependent methyltransferase|nr:class I SAM-dependent methyltransferase [Usitatibacter sp.]